MPNRGRALRAGEVRAIIDKCKTIDQWRELGRKPVTPPSEPDEKEVNVDFDDFERGKLEDLSREKADLETREIILEPSDKL